MTSGQAANYCFVTSDTILNWIKADCLPAQRTVGGQYRIRIDDLRHFMKRHGMSTEFLDQELETRSFCWEFHAALNDGKTCNGRVPCDECLVKKAMAFDCFALRAACPNGRWLAPECAGCEYARKWSSCDLVGLKAAGQEDPCLSARS